MNTRIYILRFPKEITDQPIICQLVKKYDLEFNILKATILVQQEGLMILELRGPMSNVRKGLDFLKKQGVLIKSIAASISRDDEKCFQCGACTGICPTGALYIHRPAMAVIFDPDKCSGCGLCVTLCPVRAMAVTLNSTLGSEDLGDVQQAPAESPVPSA
ncbi:NIL domain-containing protein [Thermodesulfobacteriota bacterium]